MQQQFDFLEKFIKSNYKDEPIYYMANPGNWGDALIRHGTLKFFRERNIQVTEITTTKAMDKMADGGNLLYGGGGGWCELWNHSTTYLNRWCSRFKIIVLPSTYQSHYAIPNTIFFRRDNGKSKQNMPDSYFCHDMAFYIQNDFFTGTGEGIGYFFRTDKESSKNIIIPSSNKDISLMEKHMSDVAPFFAAVDQYAVVHTDRLHVAIAACLLKKELHLYLGSYFKNRAVFNSSIKNNFNNAYFIKPNKLTLTTVT